MNDKRYTIRYKRGMDRDAKNPPAGFLNLREGHVFFRILLAFAFTLALMGKPCVAQAPELPGPAEPFAPMMIEAERDILSRLDDPTRYTIEATLDWERLTIYGQEKVLYTNNEKIPLDMLFLRLYPNAEHYAEGELRVEKVLVDGQEVTFTVEETIMQVNLPAPLPPEGQIEICIDFALKVPHRDDRFGYMNGVMCLGHWYPMMAVYDEEGWNLDPYVWIGDAFYSEVSLYTVSITAPAGITAVSSGLLSEKRTKADGMITWTFHSGAMRDFALAFSADFQEASGRVGETQVNSYYLPGDEKAGHEALRYALETLQIYNRLFGPYPYVELDVVESYFTVGGAPGGMEFPGLVLIGTDFYRPSPYVEEQDTVIAHEIAHQWWYGVVGNDQVDEPWLDESFATYSSFLYFEFAQSKKEADRQLFIQALLPYQIMVLMDRDAPVESSLLDFGSDLLRYQAIVYGKGALFLKELRNLVGDEAFFEILSRYYEGHKYGVARSSDFQEVLREALGEGQALYDRWITRAEGEILGSREEWLSLMEMFLNTEALKPGDFEKMQKLLERISSLLAEE